MDCDVNRALGYDPCHGCVMVVVLFWYVVYFSDIGSDVISFFYDLYFFPDIGSDVIDRIRIDLVLLYFKFLL